MREVAGDDDPVGVGMVLFDMGEATPEIGHRIEPEDRPRMDVDVGDVDDLHANAPVDAVWSLSADKAHAHATS
jgi:hypothetical protein